MQYRQVKDVLATATWYAALMGLASDGLGGRLYDARIARDLTMDQLNEKSSISQSTISRLERGLHVADAVTIEKLSLALKVDPCWLAFGTGERPDFSTKER